MSCFFLALVLLLGCGGTPDEFSDPELTGAEALGLPRGARLHKVILGGRGAEEHVLPSHVRVRPGDAVEFVTVDHRVHILSFPDDSLSTEVLAFLSSTEQKTSHPLLTRGNRFILRLEDAPIGLYPFVSEAHGGMAGGLIEVLVASDTVEAASLR